MLRWIATLAILGLLALDGWLPSTMLGRRGIESRARLDVEDAVGRVGEFLPDIELVGLDGGTVRLSDFRGQRVLLTFERSVDW